MGRFETLEAGGRSTRLYVAGGIAPRAPGVVVFHAWWGLNDDLTAYADALADAGYAVMAPDLYGGPVVSTIEDAERLSDSMDQQAGDAFALAAVDRLAGELGPATRMAAVGFSLGAAWALWSPAERTQLGGSVVYYGTMGGPSLGRTSVPVLGHFAETDPFEPGEEVDAFESALRSAGRQVSIHRYPGTGHWFAEPSRDAFRPDAAQLAFERTLEFLGSLHAPEAADG